MNNGGRRPENAMKHLILPALLAVASTASAAAGDSNTAVAQLDLQRYRGQWHEVARLPMFFQRQCVGDVTARYTPQADGRIEVRNACRTKDGTRDESVGVARPVAGKPGQLKVRFAPGWLSWAPFVWADYWVIALDPDYRWAVVGGPSKKYLWILSREPAMAPALLDQLIADAQTKGYDTSALVRSETR
jgi:apolipoprotein D and lipocalin family protein